MRMLLRARARAAACTQRRRADRRRNARPTEPAENCVMMRLLLPVLVHLLLLGDAAVSQQPPLCRDYSTDPGLPIYHIMGAMNGLQQKFPGQSCCLNDVNGIFSRHGVHHVLHQREFSSIAHVVSTDMVRWWRVKDAVGSNPWHNGGAWDGSVSLLPDGRIAILYDSPPEPSNISLAWAANLNDPLLENWTKVGPLVPGQPWHIDMGSYPGPCKRVIGNITDWCHNRVMFPSNIWRTQVAGEAEPTWNMLVNLKNQNTSVYPAGECNATSVPPCYNVSHGWAAALYTTTNSSFESWQLTDRNFHESLGRGSDSFYPLVKTAPGISDAHSSANVSTEHHPRWMLNTGIGEKFVIGEYDAQRAIFTPEPGPAQVVELGNATWFASGPSTNNRTITIGWLDTLGKMGIATFYDSIHITVL